MMEYDYFKLVNNGETLHLVRVDVYTGQIASGIMFQNTLKHEEGEGKIIVIIKDANGVHTATLTNDLDWTDEKYNNLNWIQKQWGN